MAGNRSLMPYAPRREFLMPIISLALSLPTLITVVGLSGLAMYHALSGQSLVVSEPLILAPAGFGLIICYIVFGPVLGVMLCVSQRARAERTFGSGLLLGYRMKRLNALALICAGSALAALMLIALVGLMLRGGT